MERELIEFIRKRFNPKSRICGAGVDDTAVINVKSGKMLLSSDMLVEGKHFLKSDNMYKVGKKCANVSISDIASMGGKPLYFLLSLGIPKGFSIKKVKRFFAGLKYALDRFDVSLVGGDIVGSSVFTADGFIVGVAEKGRVLKRGGAKLGDFVFATGCFGYSFETGWHFDFKPRVDEIDFLKRYIDISSCTDASDGLYASLRILSSESGVGMKVFADRVPQRRKERDFEKSMGHIFFDGEDFELVFTGRCRDFERVANIFYKKFGVPLSLIGEVIEGRGIKVFYGDRAFPLKGSEYDHFR